MENSTDAQYASTSAVAVALYDYLLMFDDEVRKCSRERLSTF